jgi:hypothetical protein
LQSIALSLKAAEFASSALALMARVHSGFPGIEIPMGLSARLLSRSVVAAVTFKVNGYKHHKINGFHHHKEPRKPVEREEDEGERSAWEPSSPQESSRCKALLLEVLRRAAHDWVLYRSHSKLVNREIAQDAFEWLFEEDEDHISWRERTTAVFTLDDEKVTGVRCITSFLSICEALELDPEIVRTRVRQMDIQTIISAGRPAETRKVKSGEAVGLEECGVMIGVDVNAMPSDRQYETQYESYGSVATPDILSINDVYSQY